MVLLDFTDFVRLGRKYQRAAGFCRRDPSWQVRSVQLGVEVAFADNGIQLLLSDHSGAIASGGRPACCYFSRLRPVSTVDAGNRFADSSADTGARQSPVAAKTLGSRDGRKLSRVLWQQNGRWRRQNGHQHAQASHASPSRAAPVKIKASLGSKRTKASADETDCSSAETHSSIWLPAIRPYAQL